MKKFTKLIALAMACAMVMSLAACGSSRSSSSSHNKSADAVTADIARDDMEYYTQETMAMAGESYSNGLSEAAYYEDDIEYQGSRETVTQLPANTMLIRRVTMNVETTNYDGVNSTVTAKVAELGGYIESSNSSGTGKNGDLRNITYVIRVPIDKLDPLINTVGDSCTVLSSNENTEDVTLQYSDIQSRISSLRVEQETLMNLLAQADSLEAIITLQNRLTEVRYEIESYESRARVLENQSSYSTLTLYVREVLEETEQVETKKLTFGEEIAEGLKESLEDIREDGKDFIIGFVSALPYLLIFAIIVVIVVLIIRAIIKSAKKKAARKAQANAQAKAQANAKAAEPAEKDSNS
ncbi:MAG: DUF4349 domain-containing protein [Clostridiales bacterium]|nr:DUF4349 domain-containing protein [Clostridiales bacterium]